MEGDVIISIPMLTRFLSPPDIPLFNSVPTSQSTRHEFLKRETISLPPTSVSATSVRPSSASTSAILASFSSLQMLRGKRRAAENCRCSRTVSVPISVSSLHVHKKKGEKVSRLHGVYVYLSHVTGHALEIRR